MTTSKQHQNKEFSVNEAVAHMINAQMYKLDFGQQHKATSKSCNRFLFENSFIILQVLQN